MSESIEDHLNSFLDSLDDDYLDGTTIGTASAASSYTLTPTATSTVSFCTPRSFSLIESLAKALETELPSQLHTIWSGSNAYSYSLPRATPALAARTVDKPSPPLAPAAMRPKPAQHEHKKPKAAELKFKSYLGTPFTIPPDSRFFVIKSFSLLDVNAAFINGIWASTDLGNKRLSNAYRKCQNIFLFFAVNASGKFCGVARMKGDVDFNKTSDIWVENTRWKGIFPIEWLLVKDIPNKYFHNLKVPLNENKPVSNSRDTQEVPFDVALATMKIFASFRSSTSFLTEC